MSWSPSGGRFFACKLSDGFGNEIKEPVSTPSYLCDHGVQRLHVLTPAQLASSEDSRVDRRTDLTDEFDPSGEAAKGIGGTWTAGIPHIC